MIFTAVMYTVHAVTGTAQGCMKGGVLSRRHVCDSLPVPCCSCGAGRGPVQHEFSVFWVPRRSTAVERVLEDEGVYGEVTQV